VLPPELYKKETYTNIKQKLCCETKCLSEAATVKEKVILNAQIDKWLCEELASNQVGVIILVRL